MSLSKLFIWRSSLSSALGWSKVLSTDSGFFSRTDVSSTKSTKNQAESHDQKEQLHDKGNSALPARDFCVCRLLSYSYYQDHSRQSLLEFLNVLQVFGCTIACSALRSTTDKCPRSMATVLCKLYNLCRNEQSCMLCQHPPRVLRQQRQHLQNGHAVQQHISV